MFIPSEPDQNNQFYNVFSENNESPQFLPKLSNSSQKSENKPKSPEKHVFAKETAEFRLNKYVFNQNKIVKNAGLSLDVFFDGFSKVDELTNSIDNCHFEKKQQENNGIAEINENNENAENSKNFKKNEKIDKNEKNGKNTKNTKNDKTEKHVNNQKNDENNEEKNNLKEISHTNTENAENKTFSIDDEILLDISSFSFAKQKEMHNLGKNSDFSNLITIELTDSKANLTKSEDVSIISVKTPILIEDEEKRREKPNTSTISNINTITKRVNNDTIRKNAKMLNFSLEHQKQQTTDALNTSLNTSGEIEYFPKKKVHKKFYAINEKNSLISEIDQRMLENTSEIKEMKEVKRTLKESKEKKPISLYNPSVNNASNHVIELDDDDNDDCKDSKKDDIFKEIEIFNEKILEGQNVYNQSVFEENIIVSNNNDINNKVADKNEYIRVSIDNIKADKVDSDNKDIKHDKDTVNNMQEETKTNPIICENKKKNEIDELNNLPSLTDPFINIFETIKTIKDQQKKLNFKRKLADLREDFTPNNNTEANLSQNNQNICSLEPEKIQHPSESDLNLINLNPLRKKKKNSINIDNINKNLNLCVYCESLLKPIQTFSRLCDNCLKNIQTIKDNFCVSLSDDPDKFEYLEKKGKLGPRYQAVIPDKVPDSERRKAIQEQKENLKISNFNNIKMNSGDNPIENSKFSELCIVVKKMFSEKKMEINLTTEKLCFILRFFNNNVEECIKYLSNDKEAWFQFMNHLKT